MSRSQISLCLPCYTKSHIKVIVITNDSCSASLQLLKSQSMMTPILAHVQLKSVHLITAEAYALVCRANHSIPPPCDECTV